MFEEAQEREVGILLNGGRGNLIDLMGISNRLLCITIKKIALGKALK